MLLLDKKKLYGPFLWIGFNCLKATATSRRQFTFYHSVPRNSWYSFYRPWKNERLSRPWSHPVVLNTGLLDWESSAFTTTTLLHKDQVKFPQYSYLWQITSNCQRKIDVILCFRFSLFPQISFSLFKRNDIGFNDKTVSLKYVFQVFYGVWYVRVFLTIYAYICSLCFCQ